MTMSRNLLGLPALSFCANDKRGTEGRLRTQQHLIGLALHVMV
jgi:hypothetical protein